MRSFFIDPSNISGKSACVIGPEVKHIRSVLRIEAGQEIMLFDGTGMIYKAQITGFTKKQIDLTISSKKKAESLQPYLHLGQAVIKKKNMDLIVQKATELGVSSFYPFSSEHCSPNYQPEKQKDRWQKISLEACKQCSRPIPPQVNDLVNFSEILEKTKNFSHKLILWEKERSNRFEPMDKISPTSNIILLIGPEGGFTSEEINKAMSHDFKPLSLGNSILRAETAAISALAITKYLIDKAIHNN